MIIEIVELSNLWLIIAIVFVNVVAKIVPFYVYVIYFFYYCQVNVFLYRIYVNLVSRPLKGINLLYINKITI